MPAIERLPKRVGTEGTAADPGFDGVRNDPAIKIIMEKAAAGIAGGKA